MYVRVRLFGKPDTVIVVKSKLMTIEHFRHLIKYKLGVEPKFQRLLYGGKLLEDEYTFHDYNIKLNDVIQLFTRTQNDNTSTSYENKSVEKIYKDATSTLYAIGDLIDMRDLEFGAWFEGKIIKILSQEVSSGSSSQQNSDKEKDSGCQTPNKDINENGSQTKEGVTVCFNATPETTPKHVEKEGSAENLHFKDDDLIYQIQLDASEEDSDLYSCSLKEIRPRARNVIDIEDLMIGQTVMINYNADQPSEKGYWFDFKVSQIKKLRSGYELVGTLYLGPEAIPQNDTKIPLHDKLFAIEEVIPLADRNDDHQRAMVTPPEKRSIALVCPTCRDQEGLPCKDCGCYSCLGKENPEKIVLCDECNKGYHMKCLSPPLTQVPEDDWYCPSCKRDPTDVVAPGASKQTKKEANSKRDWGRGMACVGKTKTCSMPPNHFGPIPGIEVGMCWRFRIQLSESGVHRPPVSGIHGRDVDGAYSIVLSGGYEDDEDNGYEFTYTGSGGRDLSGNKRTAEQSCDQTLTRENKALARNCAVKQISEEGGDAGDNWRKGKPVRVVRSYKMLKHFPKFAPKEGIRYDGIYKVVKYYPEKGLSGYRVWKYLLRRDDSSPAPWESGAKQYPIVYPDGYLEAEAEKKALKENNNSGRVSRKRQTDKINNSDCYQPKRLRKNDHNSTKPNKENKNVLKESISSSSRCSSEKISDMFSDCLNKYKDTKLMRENGIQNCKEDGKEDGQEEEEIKEAVENEKQEMETDKQEAKSEKDQQQVVNRVDSILTAEEKYAINADTVNKKLWQECAAASKEKGKKEFMEHVVQIFLCIICQDVAAAPVTTPCSHIFCMACLKRAFKSCSIKTCPCCRQSLSEDDLILNEKLKTALQTLMPGYDSGK